MSNPHLWQPSRRDCSLHASTALMLSCMSNVFCILVLSAIRPRAMRRILQLRPRPTHNGLVESSPLSLLLFSDRDLTRSNDLVGLGGRVRSSPFFVLLSHDSLVMIRSDWGFTKGRTPFFSSHDPFKVFRSV